MFSRVLLILIATLFASPGFAACVEAQKSGTSFEGVVKSVRRQHDAGYKLSGFVIELGRPVCMTDPAADSDTADELKDVRQIHVVPATTADNAVLRARVGRKVRVSGEGMGAHTQYHLAPIVLMNSTVTLP